MADLLAPENLPFSISLALLALLALAHIAGITHFFGDHDSDLDHYDGEVSSGLASIIGVGHVPFVVWLAVLLACFGLIGLTLQHVVAGFLGAPLGATGAAAATLAITLPVNALMTRGLGTVWPGDETTAIGIEELVGRRGTVVVGTASRGNPARAVVHDRHGQAHNVMIEPHDDNIVLSTGCEVLLARRDGELFFALDGRGVSFCEN